VTGHALTPGDWTHLTVPTMRVQPPTLSTAKVGQAGIDAKSIMTRNTLHVLQVGSCRSQAADHRALMAALLGSVERTSAGLLRCTQSHSMLQALHGTLQAKRCAEQLRQRHRAMRRASVHHGTWPRLLQPQSTGY
jgi:hypothetical protein